MGARFDWESTRKVNSFEFEVLRLLERVKQNQDFTHSLRKSLSPPNDQPG